MSLFDLDPQPGTAPGQGVEEAGAPAPAVPAPQGELVRLCLVVAYDGTGFRGFAAQNGHRTVGGELAAALETVLRQPVELTCAGRTDAGVHALGQVVHVDVRGEVDLARLAKSCATMLGPEISVRRIAVAPAGFDARRSARARHYRYLVLEAATADPLLAPTSWQVPGPLDLRAMQAGADALLGEHDFRALCRRPPGTEPDAPIVRRVLDARWSEVRPGPDGLGEGERLLRFDVSATSFCHQMVRSMVGILVEVGRGRRRAADVTAVLRAGDRSRGTPVAPPQGLCLVSVDYDEMGAAPSP